MLKIVTNPVHHMSAKAYKAMISFFVYTNFLSVGFSSIRALVKTVNMTTFSLTNFSNDNQYFMYKHAHKFIIGHKSRKNYATFRI